MKNLIRSPMARAALALLLIGLLAGSVMAIDAATSDASDPTATTSPVAYPATLGTAVGKVAGQAMHATTLGPVSLPSAAALPDEPVPEIQALAADPPAAVEVPQPDTAGDPDATEEPSTTTVTESTTTSSVPPPSTTTTHAHESTTTTTSQAVTTTTHAHETTTTTEPATTTTTEAETTTTTHVHETTPTTAPPPSGGVLSETEARDLFAVYFGEADVETALRVAQCESSLNPSAYNPAGPGYGGLFQHDMEAWADRAAAAGWAGASVFDAAANSAVSAWLVAVDGWGHWPNC